MVNYLSLDSIGEAEVKWLERYFEEREVVGKELSRIIQAKLGDAKELTTILLSRKKLSDAIPREERGIDREKRSKEGRKQKV
jgi:hypothetical protein